MRLRGFKTMPKITEVVDERLGSLLESYEKWTAWSLKWWSLLITIPVIIWGYICMLGAFQSLWLPTLFINMTGHWATLWIFLWPIVGAIISSFIWAAIHFTLVKLVYQFLKLCYWDIFKNL